MIDVLMIGPFPEDPSLIKGGVQASVYGLARSLAKRSDIHNVKVISLPNSYRNRTITVTHIENIEVTYLTMPLRFLASCALHIPRILRTLKPLHNPVVHIHGTGLLQTILLTVLRIRRVHCVWTLHGITEKETWQCFSDRRSAINLARYLLYRIMERWSLRIAQTIIVDTPYVQQALPAHSNLHVIPQGIFFSEFSSLTGTREKLIVSIGVMDPRKGHHLTLAAFAHVKQHVPKAQLVIGGSVKDREYYNALKNRITHLGLSESVTLLEDVPRKDVIALLARARVFALHSREESQGIAFCEALAAGVPVVATDIGGIPYVIQNEADGFLTPYNDIAAFADAMTCLLTDDTLFDRMSAQARISAVRFDWDTITETIVNLYKTNGSLQNSL